MDLASRLLWAHRAVDRWSTFPVDQDSRPLVLTGQRVFVEHGFGSGEAKLAFLQGHYDFSADVPDGIRSELRSWGRSSSPEGHGQLGRPLAIAAATRARTGFPTDRGRRVLPAWRLDAPDALGPIWVLAPDVDPPEWRPPALSRAEPPNRPPYGHISADLALDGMTLTLHFTGGSPRFERYRRAEVVESPQAVALIPIREDIGPSGARTAEGHERLVTGRLRAPLGARVLVDLHGNAAEVRQLGT